MEAIARPALSFVAEHWHVVRGREAERFHALSVSREGLLPRHRKIALPVTLQGPELTAIGDAEKAVVRPADSRRLQIVLDRYAEAVPAVML